MWKGWAQGRIVHVVHVWQHSLCKISAMLGQYDSLDTKLQTNPPTRSFSEASSPYC